MKAITLQDPWASLVRLNEKHIETRSWSTKYRGPLLIHASKKSDVKNLNLALTEPFYSALSMQRSIVNGIPKFGYNPGCIIAKCNLADCIRIIAGDGLFHPVRAYLMNGSTVEGNEYYFGDYTPGRFAWILKDIEPLEKPIPAKGRLGLWEFDLEGALNHG